MMGKLIEDFTAPFNNAESHCNIVLPGSGKLMPFGVFSSFMSGKLANVLYRF